MMRCLLKSALWIDDEFIQHDSNVTSMASEKSDPIDELLDSIDDGSGEHLDHEVDVLVTCPKCGKWGKVRVDKRAIDDAPGHVFNYGVVAGTICPHSFMIGIDASLTAR